MKINTIEKIFIILLLFFLILETVKIFSKKILYTESFYCYPYVIKHSKSYQDSLVKYYAYSEINFFKMQNEVIFVSYPGKFNVGDTINLNIIKINKNDY